MNFLKKIRSTLIAMTATLLVLTVAHADTIKNVTKFTPDRPGVEYVKGQQGFTYPSFNNFTSNPNIASGGREGDERKFLVSRICKGGNCDSQKAFYYNTPPAAIEEGDTIRFSLYFHNNGEDPYDGGNLGSPDAKKVKIGIDLNDIADPNNSVLIRPKGFIYADNNEYRQNPNNPNTIIKDTNGNIIRTITDDVQILLKDDNLELEPVKNSGFVKVIESSNNIFEQYINGPKTINFDTVKPNNIKVNVSPYITDNKIWIEFDRLPGCFRYSGFAYFDVKVTKKNICEEFTTYDTKTLTEKEIENLTGFPGIKDMVQLNVKTLKFKDGFIPGNTKLKWTSTDPKGKFWVPGFFGGIASIGTNTYETFADPIAVKNRIYYTGGGEVKVEVTGLDSYTANTNVCKAQIFKIPVKENLCRNLSVTKTDTVTINGLEARKLDTKVEFTQGTIPADTKLKYTSTSIGGKFYQMIDTADNKKKPSLIGEKEIEVIPGTEVYFAGRGDVTVQVVGSNKCIAKTNIPSPEFCESIDVNHFSKIQPNQVTTFSAKAVNNFEKTFNGKVTYKVKSGYGLFYTKKPAGTPNPNKTVEEFDASKKIAVPQNGFCPDDAKPKFNGTDLIDLNPNSTKVPLYIDVTQDLLFKNKFDLNLFNYDPAKDPNLSDEVQPFKFNGTLDLKTSLFDYDKSSKRQLLAFAPAGGQESITVNPGETVYFVANKAGKDVIEVSTQCTTNKNCVRQFTVDPAPTTPQPETCKAASLTTKLFEDLETQLQCFNDGYHLISAKFYTDEAKTKEIPEQNVKVKWTSTDPTGSFINPKDGKTEIKGIGPVHVLYKGAGQVKAELVELNGKPFSDPKCNVTVNRCEPKIPLICNGIEVVHPDGTDVTTFEPGTLSTISAQGLYNNAEGQTYSDFNSENGVFFDPSDPVQKTLATVLEAKGLTKAEGKKFQYKMLNYPDTQELLFLTFTDASGTEALTVSASNRSESECTKTFELVTTDELVCKEIKVTADDKPAQTFKPNNLYKLKANAVYNKADHPATVDYSSTKGVFLDPEVPLQNILANHLLTQTINSTDPLTKILPSKLTKVPNDKEIYFLTFNDATEQDVLIVQASGTTESNCSKEYKFTVDEEPEAACKSIAVNHSPSKFESDEKNLIWVKPGDFGEFKGKFKFSAKTGGFYLPSEKDADKKNNREFTIQQAADGVYYKGTTDDDSVTIEAVGPLAGSCKYKVTSNPSSQPTCEDLTIITPGGKWTEDDFTDDDEQKVRIKVKTSPAGFEDNFKYRWKVEPSTAGEWEDDLTDDKNSNRLINYLEDIDPEDEPKIIVEVIGESKCFDTKRLILDDEKTDYPSIEKLIYDNLNNSWGDTTNIGGKTNDLKKWLSSKYENVTYLSIFETGSAKSATIKENSLASGKIRSNLKQGSLDYQEMLIAISENGKEKVVYKSDKFSTKAFKDKQLPGAGKVSKFQDYSKSSNSLKNRYQCSKNEVDFCIDTSWSKVESDFRNGNELEFKNTEKIDNIYIIYSMRNNTVITDKYCQTKVKPQNGCGEQFDNSIRFEAYKTNDYKQLLDSGKDDARAVAICPFVLTREGGDVFFHSALQTGIDVKACYQVENCEGPCIKREQEKKQKNVKTGAGDAASNEVLTAPSHDICKLSNREEGNVTQYQNVLKNFSSSVCELEAEVAEQWKEQNINKAIDANIQKISRFGTNKGSITIRDDSLMPSSGVYVIEGNLTIGDGVNDFLLGSNKNKPAAQTYIVKSGTLTINSNIRYDDKNSNLANPRTIPSAAFIVIDGNVVVNDRVEQIDGVVMAVRGEVRTNSNAPTFENPLRINGSLIGDVYNLFLNRRAIGDPLKDEGSVIIKYDQRIILNTPPGLGELININQLRVAN